MLGLDALKVRYGDREALAACTLELAAGQLVALIGPNGAGKSSLLKAVAGLVPARGESSWQGCSLRALGARERAMTIAYLPQGAIAHWSLPVRDIVMLGRLPYRRFGTPPTPRDRETVANAMRCADVEAFAERKVDELSGGERARVHLARVLAVEAPLMLVDEPVASLDPYHQLKIMSVLEQCAASGALVVVVLHDLGLAAKFAHRIVLLDEGVLVASGAPEQVLNAEAIRGHYRVEPYLSRHEDQLIVVPWRRLGSD